jgi:hypothetical protein
MKKDGKALKYLQRDNKSKEERKERKRGREGSKKERISKR